MRNLIKILFILCLACFFYPVFCIAQNNLWNKLEGEWTINDNTYIPASSDENLIINTSTATDQPWESVAVDFRYTGDNEFKDIGLLLNVFDRNDYHLLRLSQSQDKMVIQLLHWKYGHFRMWQEIDLPQLKRNRDYNLSIIPAPAVNYDDWRPWKIIIIDNKTKKTILSQGIENIIPCFGMGMIGLYANTDKVIFSNFKVIKERKKTNKYLSVPSIFSDGMVLQQGKITKIWGKAKPTSSVLVTIANHKIETRTGKDGHWECYLPELKASLNLKISITSDSETININNIAVGEVWLASGQSNMEMRVWQTDVSKEVHSENTSQKIRYFKQSAWPSPYPIEETNGHWQSADSLSAMGWSAVAYKFAQTLQDSLQVPIGIIASYWGGTAIESWFPRKELEKNDLTRNIANRYNKSILDWEQNSPLETEFPWCWDVAGQSHAPGYLFNGMINPLIPYTINGIIWYQGESNAMKSKQYGALFPMLIQSWREKWKNDKLYVSFVQLAGYDGQQSGSEFEGVWPQLRDEQRKTATHIPNTGMVVAFGMGDSLDIHPYQKSLLGLRLSHLALQDVYSKSHVKAHSPLLKEVEYEKNKAIIHFLHANSGLKTKDNKPAFGFEIAGHDRIFYDAKAEIGADGKTIIVTSNKVTLPIAVRYLWTNFSSKMNLTNGEGLPVSPFRTDDWELWSDKNL